MSSHQFLLPNISHNGRRRLIPVLLLTAGVLSAGSTEAHAYLDPGISSMLTQFVIAAVVGAAVSVRRVFDAIKKLLTIRVPRQFRRAPESVVTNAKIRTGISEGSPE
jgi:hypothetical protein